MNILQQIQGVWDAKTVVIILLTSPLLVGLITPVKKRSKLLFYSISGLIALANIGVLMATGYGAEALRLSGMFIFSLDRFSYLFALLVMTCWLLTMIYSSAYLRHHFQEKAETFHRYLSVTVSLVIGAGLAGNFFTLLFFYLLSIPAIYPLIALKGNDESIKAARFYIYSTLVPFLLIALPAVVLNFPLFAPFQEYTIVSLGYGPTKASLLLAMLILGLSKNCVAPFHLWLSRTAVAPTPVTALIHSVAAVQTATIALLKIAATVYGWDYLATLNDHFFETGWLTYLCGFTAIYTAYRAWKTPDLKQRFSFSTAGQLSYIITGILVGTKQTMAGAVLHIMTHSYAKLNLFFCAGIFSTVFGSVHGPDVAKCAPHKRWLAYCAAIAGLSITGFPLLAGYYSKDLLLIEEFHRHHYAAAVFLVSGSFINLIYIMPIIKACFAKRSNDVPALKQIPFAMGAAVVICTVIILTFSQFVFLIMRVLG